NPWYVAPQAPSPRPAVGPRGAGPEGRDMADDATREALYRALDADPADALALGALADWCEEQGDLAASACLRRLLRQRLRPGRKFTGSPFGDYFWEHDGTPPILDDPRARLPRALWQALAGNGERRAVVSFKSYVSPRAAYEALLAAWRTAAAED